MHIYHSHKNSFCFTEAIFHKYAFFINFSKRLEPADHGKSNQELKLDKNHNLREENTKYCVLCQQYRTILHNGGCAGHLFLCL